MENCGNELGMNEAVVKVVVILARRTIAMMKRGERTEIGGRLCFFTKEWNECNGG